MFKKSFLPPVADLLAFEAARAAPQHLRAADELHLTQSAVSRQIRQLEQQLGIALFHRVRQRIVLTDIGRVYAADVRAVLQQLSGASQKVMASAGGGLLNLAVLPTLGTRWLIPRLGGFVARHPEVTVNFAARSEPRLRAGALRRRHPLRRAALGWRGLRLPDARGGGAGLQPGLRRTPCHPAAAGPGGGRAAAAEHPADPVGGMVRAGRRGRGAGPARPALGAVRDDRAGRGVGPRRGAAAQLPGRGGDRCRRADGAVPSGAHQRRRLLPGLPESRAQVPLLLAFRDWIVGEARADAAAINPPAAARSSARPANSPGSASAGARSRRRG